MENISDPYVIHYPRIVAVADETGSRVDLIEFFDCAGGAMWSKRHYAQSPIVMDVRCVGSSMRYTLKTGTVDLALEGSRFPAGISACIVDEKEIAITYIGMGGGGVGAAACRSDAAGVLRSKSDPAGGGKVAGATIWIPPKRGQHGRLSTILPGRLRMSARYTCRIRSSSSFRYPTGPKTAWHWWPSSQPMTRKVLSCGSTGFWKNILSQKRPGWQSIPVSLPQKRFWHMAGRSNGGRSKPACRHRSTIPVSGSSWTGGGLSGRLPLFPSLHGTRRRWNYAVERPESPAACSPGSQPEW